MITKKMHPLILGGLAGVAFPIVVFFILVYVEKILIDDVGDQTAMVFARPVMNYLYLWGFTGTIWHWEAVYYLIYFVPYLIGGALVGWIISILPTRTYRIAFIAALLALIIIPMVMMLQREKKADDLQNHVDFTFEDCDKLRGDEVLYCYQDVYRRNPPDIEVCDKFPKDLENNHLYLTCVAYAVRDAETTDVCNQIADDAGRDKCIIDTIHLTNFDPAVCEQMAIEKNRFSCYDFLAFAKKDFSFCEKLPLEDPTMMIGTREECVAYLAQAMYFECSTIECVDAICAQISDPTDNGTCLWHVNELLNQ